MGTERVSDVRTNESTGRRARQVGPAQKPPASRLCPASTGHTNSDARPRPRPPRACGGARSDSAYEGDKYNNIGGSPTLQHLGGSENPFWENLAPNTPVHFRHEEHPFYGAVTTYAYDDNGQIQACTTWPSG